MTDPWRLIMHHIAEKQVIRIGFEPMTYSLEGCRSIQLSYRTWNDRATEKQAPCGSKDNLF